MKKRNLLRWWIATSGLAIILVAAGVTTLAIRYGSIRTGLIHLRGGRSLVAPVTTLSVGSMPPGSSATTYVAIVNPSSTTYRILGSKTSCDCVVTDGIPLTIPSRDHVSVAVQVRAEGDIGEFVRLVELYTNDPAQPVLGFRIQGRVTSSGSIASR